MKKPVTSRSNPESRRAYTRWHYQQNKAAYVARAMAKNLETQAAIRTAIDNYLSTHACIDCGESDRIVLEFDHRPGETKRFNLGDAGRNAYTVRSAMEEIAKCDVRCANCHRRQTYLRSYLVGRA